MKDNDLKMMVDLTDKFSPNTCLECICFNHRLNEYMNTFSVQHETTKTTKHWIENTTQSKFFISITFYRAMPLKFYSHLDHLH